MTIMHKLELSDDAVKVIGAALAKGPYELVAPILADIRRQMTLEAPTKETAMAALRSRSKARPGQKERAPSAA